MAHYASYYNRDQFPPSLSSLVKKTFFFFWTIIRINTPFRFYRVYANLLILHGLIIKKAKERFETLAWKMMNIDILTKEKDYLRKLLIYIYIYTLIQIQTKISPVFGASGVFPILTRRASPLSLFLSIDKRRKNRSVPYGQRSCTGCCSFIRGDQLARRMADNGSIKKSCYCRVAVENFDVAKQDGKRSRSRTILCPLPCFI